MRKRQYLKRAFALSLAVMLGLTSFTGCGKKSKKDDNVATASDATVDGKTLSYVDNYDDADYVKLDDGSFMTKEAYENIFLKADNVDKETGMAEGWEYWATSPEDYDKAVSNVKDDIPTFDSDVTIKYNGVKLTYPYDMSVFENDGWVYSDESFLNKQAGSDGYTDEGVYRNDKYPGMVMTAESLEATSTADGDTVDLYGILGNKDILDKYGAYILALYIDDESAVKDMPEITMNDVCIFGMNSNMDMSVLNSIYAGDDTSYVREYMNTGENSNLYDLCYVKKNDKYSVVTDRTRDENGCKAFSTYVTEVTDEQ